MVAVSKGRIVIGDAQRLTVADQRDLTRLIRNSYAFVHQPQ